MQKKFSWCMYSTTIRIICSTAEFYPTKAFSACFPGWRDLDSTLPDIPMKGCIQRSTHQLLTIVTLRKYNHLKYEHMITPIKLMYTTCTFRVG